MYYGFADILVAITFMISNFETPAKFPQGVPFKGGVSGSRVGQNSCGSVHEEFPCDGCTCECPRLCIGFVDSYRGSGVS